jgi:hypothetical protein
MMKIGPTNVTKIAVLLVISIGLFWFSEDFSAWTIFEPETRSWILWMSYAKDLLQPFALYFLFCLGANWVKTWQWRALLAFGIPALIEFGQYLYYRFPSGYYMGSFDPLDILVYAIGVGLAVMLEQKILAKWFPFWQQTDNTSQMVEESMNA